MAAVVLDPYLLAVPAVSEGREVAAQYVTSIVEWSLLTGLEWIEVQTPRDTIGALCEAGCYPMTDAVTTLCATHGIDEFSPQDVADALARLLQRTAVYEDASQVNDVLVEPCVLSPARPDPRRSGTRAGEGRNASPIHAQTERLFAMHALLLHAVPSWSRNRCAATLDRFCGGNGVDVSGTFAIIERGARCVLPALSEPFVLPSTRVLVHEGRDEVLRALDPVILWTEVATTEAREAAIQLAVLQRDPTRGWSDAPGFTLGREFESWLPRHNFHRDVGKVRRLIDVCVDTVLGVNDAATHALRQGDGPTAPQRLRGADKAWRRDIDYEFHLHYWELPERCFEFACVVSHNVFTIPTGR